jgi:hypothetical protein
MRDGMKSGRRKAMQYLGRISGSGELRLDGKAAGPAAFDFEGFFKPAGGVACAGEIDAAPAVLQTLVGQRGVQLATKSGLVLELRLSAKKLGPAAHIAHVEVMGDLPTDPAAWREAAEAADAAEEPAQ